MVRDLAEKYTVTLVHQGTDLIEHLRESRYDLLLYIIPSLSNNITSILRNLVLNQPTLSIMLLDGEPKQTTIIEAFQIGICDYFPKPINQGLVVERINAILQQKSQV